MDRSESKMREDSKNPGDSNSENRENEEIEMNAEDDIEIIEMDDNDVLEAALDDMGLNEDENENNEDEIDEETEEETLACDPFLMKLEGHTGAIFCLDVSANNSLIATGSEDDTAIVFNSQNGEVLLHCQGHKDSVTAVRFSHDGNYLASGDLSGLIKIWKMASKEEIWSFELSDLEWLQWHPKGLVLFAGTIDGQVWMWKGPQFIETKTMQGPNVACSSAVLVNQDRCLCCGYGDGSLRIWDLKSASVAHSLTDRHQTHEGQVNCIDCSTELNLIASGGLDGIVELIQSNNGKFITKLDCRPRGGEGSSQLSQQQQDEGGEEEENRDSIESVAFSSRLSLLAVGTLAGELLVWDCQNTMLRHRFSNEGGVVKLLWLDHWIFTAGLDGCVRVFDGRSATLVKKLQCHSQEILDFRLIGRNQVITASEDQSVKIFSVEL